MNVYLPLFYVHVMHYALLYCDVRDYPDYTRIRTYTTCCTRMCSMPVIHPGNKLTCILTFPGYVYTMTAIKTTNEDTLYTRSVLPACWLRTAYTSV